MSARLMGRSGQEHPKRHSTSTLTKQFRVGPINPGNSTLRFPVFVPFASPNGLYSLYPPIFACSYVFSCSCLCWLPLLGARLAPVQLSSVWLPRCAPPDVLCVCLKLSLVDKKLDKLTKERGQAFVESAYEDLYVYRLSAIVYAVEPFSHIVL